MRLRLPVMFLLVAAPMLAAMSPTPAPLPGTYTNEEEVYFDREAKRTPAPWVGLVVPQRREFVELMIDKLSFVDEFGRPVTAISYSSLRPSNTKDRLVLRLANGRETELRLARPATCWGAIRKDAKKADGSDDFYGKFGLKLHDQGGRVSFGGEPGVKPVVLRLRNVIWPSGPNRPSLVLYIHTPDDPDRAVSYSWADKDAKTVGINLRWMQASCTIDDISGEKPK